MSEEEREKRASMSVEERLARVEGRLEELSKRTNDLRSNMNHRFDDISKRIGRLENRFWWLVGLMISMWVTIILTIIIA